MSTTGYAPLAVSCQPEAVLVTPRSSFTVLLLSFIVHHSALIVLRCGLVGRGAGLGQVLVQLQHPLDQP
jgi:hypothetical protein